MTKSVTKVQDKDTNKRLSVVRSTEDPTKYGVVILNPDGSKISGPKGDKGDPGEAGKVAVGTTTTGQPGTSASVTNTGTPSCAVLNFTIPRGDKGASGQDGNGIACITCEKVGKVTTVTVYETNGCCAGFSVCDGLDGEGSGDVLGPSVSADDDIVLFDGTSGKLIKDSGKKISCFADVSSNQTIGGQKTFTTSPLVPNKTSDVSNDGTAIATEAQVKAVKDAIPGVVDSLCCSSTTSALSANQGKELKSLIDKYTGLGRFLSLWNATTGLPMSFPLDIPYTYKTGDWYMVEVVGGTNYKPSGSSYTGSASAVVDSVNNVEVRDVYIYDGTDWLFQKNNETQVSFSDIAGVPSDNVCLGAVLNSKADNSCVVHLAGNETITGVKTFDSEIVLPNKTSSATNSGTKPATEAQVYNVAQSIPTNNNELANGCGYTTCLGTITSSDIATATDYGLVKLGSNCVQSVNAGTPSGCMGRSYAVQNDSTGNMVVNVPWVESIVKSSTEPASPSEGDVWYDTANDVLKVYNGGSWEEVGGLPSGGTEGQVVTKTADGVAWEDPSGGITNDTAGTTTTVAKIWAGTEAEYSSLATKDEHTIYYTF